ncbi:MAG TPA: acyltransferase [Candidatus Acidoferrales bacterium]|jgi:peptidoglycan/LPS O-acetylase OafA/YrhL
MKDQSAGQHLKQVYVPAFDGLRGTVLTVMFVHLEMFCPVLTGHPLIKLLFYQRTWYTLNIFFCLSGFLITWLLATEIQTTGNLNLLRFYRRRTVRLLPAYLTAIILAGLLASVSGYTPGQIFHDAAYFLTYSYNQFVSASGVNFAPAIGLFLLPAWSLCVEEQFYFAWSVALKWLKMKRALTVVVWSLVLLIVYRCALMLEMRNTGHSMDQIYVRFYFGSDTRIHAILIGCAAALGLQNRRYYDIARKYLKARALPFLLPVAIAAIVFLTARGGEASFGYQLYGGECSLILLAAWIVCLLFQPDSLVSRVLSTRPFTLLGRISYGLYIFHFLVIRLVARLLDTSSPPYSLSRNLAAWFIVGVVTTLIAMVHFYLIELPLQRRFKGAARIPDRPNPDYGLAPVRQPQAANALFMRGAEDAKT